MQLVESFSATKPHPSTLKPCRAVVWKFDTGHTMVRYYGGAEFFTRADGWGLSPKTGATLIAQMRKLAA